MFSKFVSESLTTFMGMAKPIFCPCLETAVFTPITSPLVLKSGPPELPELMAASVWMTFSSFSTNPSKGLPAVMPRPRPETTPVVTVLRNSPSAVPIAITYWPTFNLSESPRVTVGKPCVGAFFTWSTAMSFLGSR